MIGKVLLKNSKIKIGERINRSLHFLFICLVVGIVLFRLQMFSAVQVEQGMKRHLVTIQANFSIVVLIKIKK